MKNGGPAFPVLETFQQFDEDKGRYVDVRLPAGGMTLRDYFAAKAINGLLASGEAAPWKVLAENAYRIADAMLKAREEAA